MVTMRLNIVLSYEKKQAPHISLIDTNKSTAAHMFLLFMWHGIKLVYTFIVHQETNGRVYFISGTEKRRKDNHYLQIMVPILLIHVIVARETYGRMK